MLRNILTGVILGLTMGVAMTGFSQDSFPPLWPGGAEGDLQYYCSGLLCAESALNYTAATNTLKLDSKRVVTTHVENFSIEDPVDADDSKIQFKLDCDGAATITQVICSTDTGTATADLDYRAEGTPNTNGTTIDASIACAATPTPDESFTDATVDDNSIINLDINGAPSGAPTILRGHVTYTCD